MSIFVDRQGSLELMSAAEVPAYPNCTIASIRASESQIRRAQTVCVTAHPVYRMLRNAEIEVPGQLNAYAEQDFNGDGREGVGVAELGHIVAEEESRGRKDQDAAERSEAEELRLYIAAEHVAGEISTRRACPSILAGP